MNELSDQLGTLVLVGARLSGMLVTSPWLTLKGLPGPWKVLLVVTLTMVVYPVLPHEHALCPSLEALAVCSLWELAIGGVIGFLTGLASSVVLSAGSLLDMQTGLSSATLLDPTHAENRTLLSSLYQAAMMLLLWGAGAQERLIMVVANSFRYLPVGHAPGATAGFSLAGLLLGAAGHYFSLLLSLALPMTLALLGVELLLALFSRLVPQVNMMIAGAPFKILLGYLLIWVSLPTTLNVMDRILMASLDGLF